MSSKKCSVLKNHLYSILSTSEMSHLKTSAECGVWLHICIMISSHTWRTVHICTVHKIYCRSILQYMPYALYSEYAHARPSPSTMINFEMARYLSAWFFVYFVYSGETNWIGTSLWGKQRERESKMTGAMIVRIYILVSSLMIDYFRCSLPL